MAVNIEATRARIRELRESIDTLANAPLDVEALRTHVENEIRQLLQQHHVELFWRPVAHGERLRFPSARPSLANSSSRGLEHMAWLFGPKRTAELIVERLLEDGLEPGQPLEQRRKELQRLEKEVFDLEVAEHREIGKLIDGGLPFDLRPDADPKAILEAWRK